MTDNTAIAKVLEDEDDEEKKGLVDNEDDINTPSGVLKQMNFIGDKITEVSDHFKRTRKTFFYSVIFRHFKIFIPLMNLINCYILFRVQTHSWDKNTFTLVFSQLFSLSFSV